jgi:UDP-N-acetylglucosamine 2-epimerase (non-hydrolysing)
MAPVLRQLRKQKVEFNFVATGQHYDYDMSMQFIDELGLPKPTMTFRLSNSRPASQIGEIMGKLETVLDSDGSQLLFVQGDTNSMLAAAITGVKLGVRVAHLEAGLRSNDWRMPEEHNRRMVDHVSDFLFAPTARSQQNLLEEHVYGEITVTGNTIVDAVDHYLPIAERKSSIMTKIPYSEFCLATIHRRENADSPQALNQLVDILLTTEQPVVLPLHPRTNKRLQELHLSDKLASSSRIFVMPPLGYFDTLVLLKKCKFIMTDSGGLQEEATVPCIKKPTIVLRSSTERPEAVDAGFSRLVGTSRQKAQTEIRDILNNPPRLPDVSPFGDGKASETIVRIVREKLRDIA